MSPSFTQDTWDILSDWFLLLLLSICASGTTWIQEIVDMIEQNGDVEKCQRAIIQHRHPFIEWARPPQLSGKSCPVSFLSFLSQTDKD